ncbi:MAG: PmbA/TldA family metallopeptidase, partial [Nitriliruptorales bacterium]
MTATDLGDIAERLIELVGGRAEAEATVHESDDGLTRFANSFIHQHVGERTVSASLKCAVDGRVASANTTDTSDDGLTALVEQVLAAAGVRPVDP